MDNNYQGQFGQNQQVQGTNVPNQQMQNPYMNNQYGQNSYVPNQQMPNQYGQGVNPNMYTQGTMPPQQPYGMYGYNNPIPPMDPAVHAQNVKKANTSKKVFIGLIIGGAVIGVGVIVLAIVLLIGLFFDSYDFGDYENVTEICEEVFDVELEKVDTSNVASYWGASGYDIEEYAFVRDNKGYMKIEVQWIKFDTESEADDFYLEYSEVLEEEFEEVQDDYTSHSSFSGVNMTEVKLSKGGTKKIGCLVQDDECIMFVSLIGDKEDVDDMYDEFIDEID